MTPNTFCRTPNPVQPNAHSQTSVLAATVAALVLATLVTGCVSKSKAKQQAKDAYVAGQQQAMTKLMQQQAGPSITIIGPVRAPTVTYTEGLTVAKAIILAGYEPPAPPKQIIILRNGFAIPVDPKQLLAGQDVPLQKGDMLQINP